MRLRCTLRDLPPSACSRGVATSIAALLFLPTSALASYLLGFLVALLASLGLTYVVRGQARRFELFDAADERKVHTGAIPRVGGIAIVAATAISLGVFYLVSAGHPLGQGQFIWSFDGSGLARVLVGACRARCRRSRSHDGIGAW